MHHSKKQSQGRCVGQTLKAGLLLGLLLTGCQHYNAINFVTNTQFGAKVGVNAEKIPEIQIGYNRQEAARVPVYLMTTRDELSASPPTINALLDRAEKELVKAKAVPWAQANVDSIKLAQRLIDQAIAMDTASASNMTSTLLREIKSAAGKLSVNLASAEPPENIEFVRQLILAEMSKPRFYGEFNELAKFVGTRNDAGSKDAYSVLGTFRGGGSGSTTGAQANLKIAQYFATGIAAQLLAQKGGAAMVNPSAKAPQEVDANEVARIQDETRKSMKSAETVAEKVWANTAAGAAPDKAARRTVLAKAFQGIRIRHDTQPERDSALDFYAGLPDKAALKSNLENSFAPLQLSTMVNNLNQ